MAGSAMTGPTEALYSTSLTAHYVELRNAHVKIASSECDDEIVDVSEDAFAALIS
jgi:hypothetical protein